MSQFILNEASDSNKENENPLFLHHDSDDDTEEENIFINDDTDEEPNQNSTPHQQNHQKRKRTPTLNNVSDNEQDSPPQQRQRIALSDISQSVNSLPDVHMGEAANEKQTSTPAPSDVFQELTKDGSIVNKQTDPKKPFTFRGFGIFLTYSQCELTVRTTPYQIYTK